MVISSILGAASKGIFIPQHPDNPIYVYCVQWQRENDLIPNSKDLPNMSDAMQFCLGALSSQLKDIVFFSITRRLA